MSKKRKKAAPVQAKRRKDAPVVVPVERPNPRMRHRPTKRYHNRTWAVRKGARRKPKHNQW